MSYNNNIDVVRDELSLRTVGSKTADTAAGRVGNEPYHEDCDVESLKLEKRNTITDPVFGEIDEDGPNYRNVSNTCETSLFQR